MGRFGTYEDRDRLEAEMAYEARDLPVTIHDFLSRTAKAHPDRPAISFQLLAGPRDPATTLTWQDLLERVTETANLFRKLGIGPTDTVAYLLPNSIETPVVLLAGATAGIVNPINPLLDAKQIAGILRETRARVLVTLKSFPRTDVAQKAAEAVAEAPGVTHIIEIDLRRHLRGPKRFLVPLLRPRVRKRHKARVLDFEAAASAERHTRLDFEDIPKDRIAAYFHTGGTTGTPKVAQHSYRGMIYNGWLGGALLFDETDVLMCPLPMFHVFAAYPVLMSCIASGAHVVMPTPAGYRGEGVFDNFWKLIERWQATFLITVPTAISALMQRPVDADVSSLKTAISGSAPLPMELYNRFKSATGVEISEGYGLTEATCLVSCNPVDGMKKVGSVGIPLPYTHVRILNHDDAGRVHECATDEVGEICVANPGVLPGSTYTEADKNHDLFAEDRYLRTGDLGRLDSDGYLWITGRAKDLIIRGGHNIDPAEIEDALLSHPAVAFAGAIGQPDAFAGELPCVYVELVADAQTSVDDLMDHARRNIHERAAAPKYVEILPELPKTAVGKIFKPELRKLAITRVYDAALDGTGCHVIEVIDDKKRGLVARLSRAARPDEDVVAHKLGEFTRPWEWAD
ncbi:MAG: acyl-CoA synthetase [Paracoccus sp. (in: a-proteobacteria)]|jgi:fatty-acyl-CoA synthase|uniref:acyl-CoA synthetase n=1 Tax=unclassified Paracoccus (in: a-proteobacteria) TaxID=2688777 RepID=UPI000C40ACC0|nr:MULTISPECIES: acyl-CoA synthetase [unclassified Paracoccus (in: a-proteobacteria)]MAN55661.1 acyl-CoA synthetase [Paracoccus sp. (in: a-proteobacteria)]MBA47761.1 acyl-CoA synthetase [Paracoccus sp. (in: a-proteobacteria)]MCS5602068.1 acyl-CoA synthetase [Paracoccus sp. (in: a-proteobacteria)]MDB2551687.1 acyl-CoA synthetase [Paracoccus sp. (in: a-proteobacteria)]HIC66408.1 acyl-CoA synthetase [Paracoccus sp. (in: a-proteobacteria)]|tara:strand:- start:8 stop:1894 length:1887 start_codon:yes stop_codon:yes gene_type:complete